MLCWMLWKMRDVGGEVEARIEEIEQATGLSTKNIATARERLKGILIARERRIEHRTFYSVDHEELQRQWDAATDGESRETPKRHLVRNAETASREEPKRHLVTIEQEQGIRTGRTEETPMVATVDVPLNSRRRTTLQPSPEAKDMVRVFAGIYGQRFGRAYVPDARQDVAAAAGLVAAGVTAEEVGRVFEAATRCKGWRASKTTTLPMLARFWNEVGAEIAKGASDKGSSDNGQSAEEWANELRNLQTPMRGTA